MPIDAGTMQYVQEQLSLVESVTVKRMFGGAGIYARGYFFALLDDDTLYFKADDSNRADYLAAGSPPFAPWGEEGVKLEYYEVPDLVLDNLSKLRNWMEKSIAVAIRAKESKKGQKRKEHKSSTRVVKKSQPKVKLGKMTKSRKTKSTTAADGKTPSRKKAKRNST